VPLEGKINLNTELKLFIISELEREDKITSAKSIAFEWNKKEEKKETITHESIYKWLKQPANDEVPLEGVNIENIFYTKNDIRELRLKNEVELFEEIL
jgi:IS30 family transposase